MSRTRVGVIALLLAVLAVIAFRGRLATDFWPLDRSPIGPNLIASAIQWAIIAIVASLLYPPFRAWVERERDKLHAKIDANHAQLMETVHAHHREAMKKADEHHAEHMKALTDKETL